MGCSYYKIQVPCEDTKGWRSVDIHINAEDDLPCLCTFSGTEEIDQQTVRSLAALGTAVICAYNGIVNTQNGFLSIPNGLPPDILNAIDCYLGIEIPKLPECQLCGKPNNEGTTNHKACEDNESYRADRG